MRRRADTALSTRPQARVRVRGREGEARPRSRPPGGSRTPQKGMHLCSARRASTGRSARRGGSAPRLLRARLARLAPGAAAPDGRGHDGAPDRHRRPPRGFAPRRVKARGAEPAGRSAERSLSPQRPRGAGPNGRPSRATKFLAHCGRPPVLRSSSGARPSAAAVSDQRRHTCRASGQRGVRGLRQRTASEDRVRGLRQRRWAVRHACEPPSLRLESGLCKGWSSRDLPRTA